MNGNKRETCRKAFELYGNALERNPFCTHEFFCPWYQAPLIRETAESVPLAQNPTVSDG